MLMTALPRMTSMPPLAYPPPWIRSVVTLSESIVITLSPQMTLLPRLMPYPPPWMTSTVVLPVRFSRAPARVCSVPMTACAPLPVAMPPAMIAASVAFVLFRLISTPPSVTTRTL